MLMDLLDSGIYGNANMSRKHSSNMTLDAVAADKNEEESREYGLKVFVPIRQKSSRGGIRILRNIRFLLPIAWTDRILNTVKRQWQEGITLRQIP